MARAISPGIPPMIPVPMEWRELAPTPVATARGRTPSTKAREVMMIGRSRISPASMVASMSERPWRRRSTAKVTRSRAFFAPSPMSTSRPIWK